MKNNLVFTGLGGEFSDEDTESKLRDFIFHELGIDNHIEFGNVHRFGKTVTEKHRPIVARFLYYNDLVNVRDSAFRLKGKPYGINEQDPAEIEQKRKKLYPVAKQYKQTGHNTKLVRDKLYINGKLFVDDRDEHVNRQQNSYSDATRGMSDKSGPA